VKEIILPPDDGALAIDVRGDLAGILAIFTKRNPPAARTRGSQFKMGAGTGFEPVTFRL
jgi:site-specific DNA recombinase